MAAESSTSPSLVSLEAAERLSQRATLSEGTIDYAGQQWMRTRDAILNGAREAASEGDVTDAAMEIRRRYQSIKRLTDEARRILLSESTPGDNKIVYAIDPHLINGYCEYWVSHNFKTFDFLNDEWRKGEHKERTEFIVFLLGAILRLNELICLRAGRQEIADMLAYFLEEHTQARERGPQIDAFAKALDEITKTAGFSKLVDISAEQISEYIWEKFGALVGAGGIPLMRQQLSRARLAEILRSGRLKSSFAAIRSKLADDGEDQLRRARDAETLFQSFLRNDDRMREARTSLYDAYTKFAKQTSLGNRKRMASEDVSRFRPGEYSNINAMFEVHLLNICLSEVQVNCRVQYITVSPLLYDFISAFPRNSIHIDLVHPRHLFIFENQPTFESLEKFQRVLVGPNAFADAVPKDDSIKLSDLDQFEDRFSAILRDVRSTYTFAPVDDDESRRELVRVIRNFASEYGGTRRAELETKLATISEHLSSASDEVERLFGNTASVRSTQGFEAYKAFIENLPDHSRSNLALVRVFEDSGKLNQPGHVPRAVFIPVSGGYRNLFKIYDLSVIKRLREKFSTSVGMITITQLLEIIEAAAKAARKDATEDDVLDSDILLEFARALYATGDREWLLSTSFAQSALRLAGFERSHEGDPGLAPVKGGTAEARRRLMIQEILLLQHFARRGVAANLESLSRRSRRLRMAARDLYLSASATQSVEDSGSYSTQYDPNTIRQALAAVALLIEWIVLKETRRAAGRPASLDEGISVVLPQAAGPHVAWDGLRFPRRDLRDYWEDASAVDELVSDLDELTKRIHEIYAAVSSGEALGFHSAEFWRYIYLRACTLRMLLAMLVKLSMVPASAVTPVVSAGELVEVRDLLTDHARFIGEQCACVDVDLSVNRVEHYHPFTNFLLDALEFVEQTNGLSASMLDMIEHSRALLSISKYHYELSETGFPRVVSQTFLSRFGPAAAESLSRIAEVLARESHFSSTPFVGSMSLDQTISS